MQFALDRQPTHVFFAVSQKAVAPPQSPLVRQPTHAPVAVSHVGTAPPQSPLPPQARQAGGAPSQRGFVAVQSEFAAHWPQRPPPQNGAVVGQLDELRHCTQRN